MSELKISLEGYDTGLKTYRYGYGNPSNSTIQFYLCTREDGLRAAKDSKIANLAEKAEKIIIETPKRVIGFNESFLKAFLGPTARKITPELLVSKVEVQSDSPHVSDHQLAIERYLTAEIRRIRERAEKKANKKSDKNQVWAHPQPLFVPDIGTRMRLTIPWTFELYSESRNMGLVNIIKGEKNTGYSSGEYVQDDPNDRYSRRMVNREVTFAEGTVLIVDRIYIRKGSGYENFSSITFRIEKGAEIVYNGKTIKLKTKPRFWAKLRDVNKMMVEVDMNTLPGQEHEGTARK